MKRWVAKVVPFAMLLAGFVLWSFAFVVLYGIQATGCRLGWQSIEVMGPVTLQRTVLVILFLGFLTAHFVLFRGLQSSRREAPEEVDSPAFTRQAGAQLALAALGAAAFCFAGVFWLSAC
ncbi:hypothetical protein [Chelativorans sp. AA-79]|uniref:hypothetical protein n=1 Tax=Chelativorans sp. AA-79 TaxID=3028735 RepID=UPI0023F93A8D|nr:hypothetical protein [Chelativorans sp. AA-79]WEX10903.1 hypothetical protein PVE73_08210 [Chelativorans sp. AA-79]